MLLLFMAPAVAVAEPIGEDDAPPLVRPAVQPGAESGRIDAPEEDSPVRKLGRGALLLPKLAIEVTGRS